MKKATKKAAKKRSTKKSAAKRELISPRGNKRYIRRDAKGRIKESDDMGRSLKQDRGRKPKKNVPVITISYPRDAVRQYLEYGAMYDSSLSKAPAR